MLWHANAGHVIIEQNVSIVALLTCAGGSPMKVAKSSAMALAVLVAGFLLNCGEFVLNRVVLHSEWSSGIHAQVDSATIILLALSMFVFAAVLVQLHVLFRQVIIRPRRSALLAGLICWILAYGIGWSWSYLLGGVGNKIYFVTLPWSLVEVLIAALVGAAVYDNRTTGRG
jgi:hypothetical protein